MSELRIENVIAASHLGKEVELIRLATELPKARYSGSGNPSVIVDINAGSNKRAAGIIFGNGKQKRNYLHVEDLANGSLIALKNEAKNYTQNTQERN